MSCGGGAVWSGYSPLFTTAFVIQVADGLRVYGAKCVPQALPDGARWRSVCIDGLFELKAAITTLTAGGDPEQLVVRVEQVWDDPLLNRHRGAVVWTQDVCGSFHGGDMLPRGGFIVKGGFGEFGV